MRPAHFIFAIHVCAKSSRDWWCLRLLIGKHTRSLTLNSYMCIICESWTIHIYIYCVIVRTRCGSRWAIAYQFALGKRIVVCIARAQQFIFCSSASSARARVTRRRTINYVLKSLHFYAGGARGDEGLHYLRLGLKAPRIGNVCYWN